MTTFIGPNICSSYLSYADENVDSETEVLIFQLVPRTTSKVVVFDSSARTMMLIMRSGDYTDVLLIPPGGGTFNFGISIGSSVSLIAYGTTATAGQNILNIL